MMGPLLLGVAFGAASLGTTLLAGGGLLSALLAYPLGGMVGLLGGVLLVVLREAPAAEAAIPQPPCPEPVRAEA